MTKFHFNYILFNILKGFYIFACKEFAKILQYRINECFEKLCLNQFDTQYIRILLRKAKILFTFIDIAGSNFSTLQEQRYLNYVKFFLLTFLVKRYLVHSSIHSDLFLKWMVQSKSLFKHHICLYVYTETLFHIDSGSFHSEPVQAPNSKYWCYFAMPKLVF